MSGIPNSVDTVNAAATAIVTAETRVQPSSTVQARKKRWGGCWNMYWCFGSYKNSKRIGHAVIASEPAAPVVVAPNLDTRNPTSTVVLPFIAPPSSPASLIQSDPPSAARSPSASLLSLTALSADSRPAGSTAPIYTIGPYANETQVVSPPVFSTFTTEPSTASVTPPPESVQLMTNPPSPDVPFAQLLSTSLARNRRNNGGNLKYSLSQYEFQPYQYPGSPGGHSKSPGSVVSTSGTSSPFRDKQPVVEFRVGEAPRFLGYEYFPSYKWGSRIGSGSLTPNGCSRLGSGTQTPNGGVSCLGSGALTPNGGISRLGSGTVTPNNGGEQISKAVDLPNSKHKAENSDAVMDDDRRVSFELLGEDIPICIVREKEPILSNNTVSGAPTEQKAAPMSNSDIHREISDGKKTTEASSEGEGDGEDCLQKNRTISLGSSKDFNFNNAKGDIPEKAGIDCEWWTSDEVVEKETSPRSSWSFFPMLGSGAN
ncbi:putative GPI-anchored protein pfl2 [Andrographis paniculata]|uniref:putative GPI-anchored protein pfl2 n=1 Tax=Andrographis paniculata TaxID=175694 RepID=UPI0021E8B5B6|nr:putative GPI-anchored protein pfl2 [Andrographis paniculata]